MRTNLLHIGFTGARVGMTTDQRKIVIQILKSYDPFILHHGDCIGADAEVHVIVCTQFKDSGIVIHPPKVDRYRAFCKCDTYHKPKDFTVRDRDIVNDTVILIGTPKSFDQNRSGTWYTIRYAKRMKKPVIIII